MTPEKHIGEETWTRVPTYTASIYVGLRPGYQGPDKEIPFDLIQEYVNRVSLCVTVTTTEFIYKDGWEPGFVVGLINYPRFPKEFSYIRGLAVELATILKKACEQNHVSIVFPDETLMIGDL